MIRDNNEKEPHTRMCGSFYPKTVIRNPKTPTEYNWGGYDVGY